jgi:hypothetical protein
MSKQVSPREIVDRQIAAYNAHDVDANCALYAEDAVLSTLNSAEELARGVAAIRARDAERFNNPALHCDIKDRIEMGDFVIDHERVI